tara:strand:- start:2663 stop:3559 length:897 start_codon:yes stop_codon:yes gene_type:complete
MIRYFLLLFVTFISLSANSQELNCSVTVNSRQVEGSEKVIFEEMQKAINEFVNSRKWTNDQFRIDEKIECNILINLTERLSTNRFTGNIQIQARRPVYGTNYYSPTVNILDRDFVIEYNQFEPLQYNETSYNGELPTILSYYVYMVLGFDYDSYSLEGGTPYFLIAQRILNNAQSSGEKGWKAFEGQSNRYWLVENYLNGQFKPFRKLYYTYHRKGFDMMSTKPQQALSEITTGLQSLLPVHNVKPSSYNLQVFFNAKKDEIISLYQGADIQNKQDIVSLLTRIDPGNANNYQKILKK